MADIEGTLTAVTGALASVLGVVLQYHQIAKLRAESKKERLSTGPSTASPDDALIAKPDGQSALRRAGPSGVRPISLALLSALGVGALLAAYLLLDRDAVAQARRATAEADTQARRIDSLSRDVSALKAIVSKIPETGSAPVAAIESCPSTAPTRVLLTEKNSSVALRPNRIEAFVETGSTEDSVVVTPPVFLEGANKANVSATALDYDGKHGVKIYLDITDPKDQDIGDFQIRIGLWQKCARTYGRAVKYDR